jgi:hypothetical protein
MFGSSILEIAIGVIFVYLVLSLICTAINEAIATLRNKRGKSLFEGIKNLLNDPTFTGLAQQVYSHGLVDGMSKGASDEKTRNRRPSYLPSKTFSLALLDILSAHGVVSAAHGAALTQAEEAYNKFFEACRDAKVDPGAASLPADPQAKKAAAEKARGALVDAERNAEAAYFDAIQAALGGAASVPAALNSARAAYVNALPAAGSAPSDSQLATLSGARGKYTDAIQAALTTSAQRLAVARAKSAFETASAALKILEAKRAAVISARDPKNQELIQQASGALEESLAAGRALAARLPNQLDNIQAAVKRLPDGHTKESLMVLIGKSKREAAAIGDEVKHFQQNVEGWFNDAMDRVGGWYKRWTQAWQITLALLVVLLLNADTLMLTKRFSTDKDLRTAILAKASTADIKTMSTDIEEYSLPLGWSSDAKDARRFPWIVAPGEQTSILGAIILKLVGLLISIGAVAMGAPFWFDMLSKFINIRGAGTPPGEKKKSAGATT